jgi:hypothetical protein
MSDNEELEGEANEGEEDEEGGEEEEDKEEEKEEPKEEPKQEIKPPPMYIPKVNPLTRVQNINRDLDMLNSEVNLLSSNFMLLTSNMTGNPTYYNVSPLKYNSGIYNPSSPMKYSSPVKTVLTSTSYWNNPNHINLSPSAGQPFYYNVPDNNFYSPQYRSSNYNAPYSGGMGISSHYSPPKYQTSYPPSYSGMNNMGQFQQPSYQDDNIRLINEIDKILAEPVSKPHPMYNTFDRQSTYYKPTFEMHTQYEPRQTSIERSKPPLYGHQRSFSQRRNDQITSMNDFYNRKPALDRHNINNSYQPITPFIKPSSPLRSSLRKSPHFQRTSRSANRHASDFEIRDAVKTLFR